MYEIAYAALEANGKVNRRRQRKIEDCGDYSLCIKVIEKRDVAHEITGRKRFKLQFQRRSFSYFFLAVFMG